MGEELGLRERKRLTAMRRIQQVALDLFDQHGYAQISIERVAAAAEVSPSSVYRYFGTKEQILLWDEYDPMAIARLAEELTDHPPLVAARRAVAAVFEEMFQQDEARTRRRVHYMMNEPSIAAATAVQAHEMAELISKVLTSRPEQPVEELEAQLLAHAIVGAVIGAMRYWYRVDFQTPLGEIIDRMFTSFESGFRLGRQPAD